MALKKKHSDNNFKVILDIFVDASYVKRCPAKTITLIHIQIVGSFKKSTELVDKIPFG